MSQHVTTQSDQRSLADLVEGLIQFDGPPEKFLPYLLAVQCHIASAEGGAVLRAGQERGPEVLATHPAIEPNSPPPVWLAQAAESLQKVIESPTTTIVPIHTQDDMYGQKPSQYLIMAPLKAGAGIRGVAAFVITTGDPGLVAQSRERIELTTSLLSLYEMRLTLSKRSTDMRRLRTAMEVLVSVDEQDRFRAASMALCNEVAAKWQAERVSFGLLQGHYIKIFAMSHTEKFTRKMKLVQSIESAMEECLDQDTEIIQPAHEQASYVSRSHDRLSQEHGPTNIVSIPLRKAGEVKGVLTIERALDQQLELNELEALRLVGELCTARLLELHKHDKWVGAKVASSMREGFAKLIGPTHTWAKVATIAVACCLAFAFFGEGTDRVEAPFVVQAIERQVVPAPFDGFLDEVMVEPDDDVIAGVTVLATLDTVDLLDQLAKSGADLASYDKQADIARRDGKTAEVQINTFQAAKVRAEMNLLSTQVKKATLMSRINGKVVAGDLKRRIGAPVQKGDVLFEIAPVHNLRAELSVPESRIADLVVNQTGELAAASAPGEYVQFTVERINPVAEVSDQSNAFKVRVKLNIDKLSEEDRKHFEKWKPGMEGIAKVEVGRQRYYWLWTREMVNWVRMKMWW